MLNTAFYTDDVATIHHEGYTEFIHSAAPELLKILRQRGIDNGLVVDAGCGSGVWAQVLSEAGYDVEGFDISPAMLRLARSQAPSADFSEGSLWTQPLPECSALTALGEVMCYRAEEASECDPESLFRRVHEALVPEGLFLFDVATIGLDRDRPPSFVDKGEWSCFVRYEYQEEPARLIRNITTHRKLDGAVRTTLERHVLQLFDPEQVSRQLTDAGFNVSYSDFYGEYRLMPGRKAFIAQKNIDLSDKAQPAPRQSVLPNR